MLEWYEAYADYDDAAERLEHLVADVAERVTGTTKVERDGVEIELAPPWRRLTLRDAIRERTGIDVLEHPTREALAAAMDSEAERPTRAGASSSTACSRRRSSRSSIQPTFIIDYPVELSPFAKRHRPRTGLVERWEAFVGGFEIANAFTELNDPDEQRRALRAAGRGAARAATTRRSPSTRPSSRRSSTACRRPAASASASTAS